MDDEFEISAFEPGQNVLIETDDSLELGVLLVQKFSGVKVYLTHRMGTAGTASASEIDRMKRALEATTTKKLRVFAREAGVGFVKSLRMSKSKLVEVCLEDAVEVHDALGSKPAMIPLMRPIEYWFSQDRIKNMCNADQYSEETFLRDLDFSLSEEIE